MRLPDIRFVDLHYKGMRIRQEWQNLKRDVFCGMCGTVCCVCMIVLCLQNGGMGILKQEDGFSHFVQWVVIPSAVIGFGVSVVTIVCIPFWNRLEDLQRLCRLIYTYPLYLVRNYIGNQEFGDEKQAVKREIIYFPSFYYQYKRGMVLITVRLDGSKFHQAGNFEDMTKILEDTYSSNVVDITQRKEYLTYHLMRNAAKNRLRMDELEVKGYKIPLMRNLSWDISKVPHGLVVGGTGGGKTYFLHVLIREFLQMDAVLYICDPKYSSLTDYRMVLPHVASDVSGIMALVEECVQVMQQRYQEIKDRPDYMPGQDFTHYHMQPIVLFFDEYTAYVSMLDRKEKEIFKQNLNQIVLKGREAGVFVILATQRPVAEYLSGNMRDQLGFRVTLGVLKEDGYRMAFGNTTQKFRSSGQPGYGFLYMNGFSFIQRFCAALVPEGYHFIEEAGKLLEQRKGGGQKDV